VSELKHRTVETNGIHEQDYMKRLFTALEGKLAGSAIMTKWNAL